MSRRIQRLSIDFNSLADIDTYRRLRLMIMGGHIENLFFANGFESFEIPNCNFVHFSMVTNWNENLNQSGKQVSLTTIFNKAHFFSLGSSEQIEYITNIVYESLKRLFVLRRLDLNFLEDIYNKIKDNDFFVLYNNQKDINPIDRSVRITLKSRSLYDCYSYKINYIVGSIVKTFDICSITPLYLPAEHDGYPKFSDPVEVVVGPYVTGWINEDEFEILCAHKKYSFSRSSESLIITENPDLKEKFVNWEAVN